MKWKEAFLVGATIGAVVIGVAWFTKEPASVVPDNTQYEQVIDSLNKEVNKLVVTNDSLQLVVDAAKAKVEVINHWYEKTLIDVTNQSIADDVRFFADYVSKVDK